MKHPFFLTTLLILLNTFSFGQKLPSGPGNNFVLPNATNYFIDTNSISWALDIEEAFLNADFKKIDDENLFNYIIKLALSGIIQAYDFRITGFEEFENYTYSSFGKIPNSYSNRDVIKTITSDSLKTIKLHEIFYLENYSLNCRITSAALMTEFTTSAGVSLGLKEILYCCKNSFDSNSIKLNNDLVHLKRINRVLNLDSLQNYRIIKQIYGWDMIQSIWYGASRGSIRIVDINTNQTLEAKNVMDYSYLDSIQVPLFDNTGYTVGYKMIPGESVFPSKLVNSIQFNQDFYFNRRRNIFISTISDCYLFVNQFGEINNEMKVEKRFKVLK